MYAVPNKNFVDAVTKAVADGLTPDELCKKYTTMTVSELISAEVKPDYTDEKVLELAVHANQESFDRLTSDQTWMERGIKRKYGKFEKLCARLTGWDEKYIFEHLGEFTRLRKDFNSTISYIEKYGESLETTREDLVNISNKMARDNILRDFYLNPKIGADVPEDKDETMAELRKNAVDACFKSFQNEDHFIMAITRETVEPVFTGEDNIYFGAVASAVAQYEIMRDPDAESAWFYKQLFDLFETDDLKLISVMMYHLHHARVEIDDHNDRDSCQQSGIPSAPENSIFYPRVEGATGKTYLDMLVEFFEKRESDGPTTQIEGIMSTCGVSIGSYAHDAKAFYAAVVSGADLLDGPPVPESHRGEMLDYMLQTHFPDDAEALLSQFSSSDIGECRELYMRTLDKIDDALIADFPKVDQMYPIPIADDAVEPEGTVEKMYAYYHAMMSTTNCHNVCMGTGRILRPRE